MCDSPRFCSANWKDAETEKPLESPKTTSYWTTVPVPPLIDISSAARNGSWSQTHSRDMYHEHCSVAIVDWVRLVQLSGWLQGPEGCRIDQYVWIRSFFVAPNMICLIRDWEVQQKWVRRASSLFYLLMISSCKSEAQHNWESSSKKGKQSHNKNHQQSAWTSRKDDTATYLEQSREKGCHHQLAAKGSSPFASHEWWDGDSAEKMQCQCGGYWLMPSFYPMSGGRRLDSASRSPWAASPATCTCTSSRRGRCWLVGSIIIVLCRVWWLCQGSHQHAVVIILQN